MASLIRINKELLRIPSSVKSAFGGANSHCFSTTACRNKRKIHRRNILEPKHPFDHRFHISPSDVSTSKPYGSRALQNKLAYGYGRPQQPGYFDAKGRFHKVPEMVPEFVVPDLDGFELKPYVSFKVPITQKPEFTAEKLFNATYAKDIAKRHKEGEKLSPETYFTETTKKVE